VFCHILLSLSKWALQSGQNKWRKKKQAKERKGNLGCKSSRVTLWATSFCRSKAFVARRRFGFHVDSLFQRIVSRLCHVHECVLRACGAHNFVLINNRKTMRRQVILLSLHVTRHFVFTERKILFALSSGVSNHFTRLVPSMECCDVPYVPVRKT